MYDCPEDMEYFHELKNKIDLAKIPEEVETPAIVNIREHYHPIATYILARNRSEQKKLQNVRKFYNRTERKSKIKIKLKETETLFQNIIGK